ncbi:16773_t:CDS:2 [Acaulospora morrowiae]|uniref:16773_t:CDS:1 n=1 Tax=Acaulospora morrowiae TaxID=94023 RepID=A0A9N8VNL2_9GLOM|nr:16773_t:CDS:2 [Acaulospora morrowiae]
MDYYLTKLKELEEGFQFFTDKREKLVAILLLNSLKNGLVEKSSVDISDFEQELCKKECDDDKKNYLIERETKIFQSQTGNKIGKIKFLLFLQNQSVLAKNHRRKKQAERVSMLHELIGDVIYVYPLPLAKLRVSKMSLITNHVIEITSGQTEFRHTKSGQTKAWPVCRSNLVGLVITKSGQTSDHQVRNFWLYR